MTGRRRIVRATVELSVEPGITKIEALRELRTRVNDGCSARYDDAGGKATQVRIKRAT